MNCDFFKLVNRELFMTKLSEIDFHENELIDVEGMKLFKPIWLSGCPIKRPLSELKHV